MFEINGLKNALANMADVHAISYIEKSQAIHPGHGPDSRRGDAGYSAPAVRASPAS
jgi:hypothetical protein